MIGISIAAKTEWEFVCNYFGKTLEERKRHPFGGYFQAKINHKDVMIYFAGNGKVRSAASCQHMIDKFNLNKVIVVGTCAGIDLQYGILDIIVPNRAVQCDCTVKEMKPLIRQDFIVDIDLSNYGNGFPTGTIGTSDRPIVLMSDYLELKKNDITVADMESAAIAYVCKRNEVEVVIIKGISDFPVDRNNPAASQTNQGQMFSQNAPIVMKKILDTYIEKFI